MIIIILIIITIIILKNMDIWILTNICVNYSKTLITHSEMDSSMTSSYLEVGVFHLN